MTDSPLNTSLSRSLGGKWIKAIPADEVQAAFGRLPSLQVLAAASILIDQLDVMDKSFFISLRGRAFSRSIKLILEYHNIRGHDLQELIRVLAHYHYVRPFFSLALPTNDDGLKQYLVDAGVLWDQILFYYEFSVWDPIRFGGGFALGVGYSATAILEVLKELFEFGIEAFKDPQQATEKIQKVVQGLRELSLESLVAMAKDQWAKWEKEFGEALLNLDFEKIGFMLGKLAGDLWQLLTGIRALAKLPGMTITLARKFGVLFAKGARYSRQALQLLVELLKKVSTLIKEAVTIGYRAITNFFTDTKLFLEKFIDGALIIIDETGMMLLNIPEKGLVLEGFGLLPEGYLLAKMDQGVMAIVASVRVEFAKAINYVNELKASMSRTIKQVKNPSQFLKDIKEAEKLSDKYIKGWRDTLQQILTDNELPLKPHEFGNWIHDHLEEGFKELAAALSKAYKNTYKASTEIQIRKLVEGLADGPAEAKIFLQRVDIPLLSFAKKWPGMFKALGVSDEKELAKFLTKMGYPDPSTTLIGDLISDGILFNKETRRLMSIDWTSGLGKYRFANAVEAAMKAGESLTDAQRIRLAQQFLKHTFREYALREAIFEFIFEGWDTKVIEIMYEPIRLLKIVP